MNNPRISVVTVCYNAVNTIEKTILSVINQTYDNIEYVIIDGASTDGTINIIKRYENRIAYWISEPDRGIYDAMNKGILKATGDWIHFLNAGDIFHNNEVIKDFIPQIQNNVFIAYGDTQYVFSIASKVHKALPIDRMNQVMPIGHPATFVKSSYHKKNLFDTSYRSSGDYKFFFDSFYKDHVEFQYIPLIVADFDAEGGTSTSNPFLVTEENARVRGIDGTIKWRMWYGYFKCRCLFLIFIKSILPQEIRKKIELWEKMTFIRKL